MNNKTENLVGLAFEELNLDEMYMSQGSGDVDAEIILTPTITISKLPISISIVLSRIMPCRW